jgi:hypothetical protein
VSAIAIDGVADRAAARDARAAEFRASRPWILLGWITGIVVIWLDPGSDDLTTFFMAIFVGYLVPFVVWLAIHRRLPEVTSRKRPYQASNAVVSLLLCFTLPSLFRAFNPMAAVGPMAIWVIAGVVLIATYEMWALVGVRWTGERRGIGPIQPDWRGTAILTALVSAAIVGFAATNQLIAALPIIPWECAGPIEFCENLPPPLPAVQEPWVIAGFYGCPSRRRRRLVEPPDRPGLRPRRRGVRALCVMGRTGLEGGR